MTSPFKIDNVTFLNERNRQQQSLVSSPSNMLNGQLPDYYDNHDITHINKEYEGNKEYTDMDILEKYIEKMDRDQSDLRNDIRASEERTERRIERLEQLILTQNQNIENRFDFLEQKLEKTEANLDSKLANMENRYSNLETRFESIKTWLLGTSIATVLSIAAMVVAIIIGGAQFIPALVDVIINSVP